MTLIEKRIPYIRGNGYYLIDSPDVAKAIEMLVGTRMLSERQFKGLEVLGFDLIENPND